MRVFLITGILGGYTTFSAFSLDAITLLERGEPVTAAIYVAFQRASFGNRGVCRAGPYARNGLKRPSQSAACPLRTGLLCHISLRRISGRHPCRGAIAIGCR